jgi:acyl-CoA synthetase (AMP-forming)/AMP-acid ligase II
LSDPKVTIYGKIDYIFSHSHQHTPGHPKFLGTWELQRDIKFGKTFLYADEFYNYYDINQCKSITSIVNAIWATPDSDLIHSTSSGTTNDPKKIVNSHKKVYSMAKRLADQYFTKGVSSMHVKTMHHGASMCYYFLPSFMVGGKQFTADGVHGESTTLAPVLKFALDNKITQLFLYNAIQVLYFLKNMPRVDHCVNIITLYQITPDMLPLLKEKNINWIKSPFGDTTIGLGFFVKTVDQNTNMLDYDVTNMGPVLDDFFQIDVRDQRLYVSCPELGEDWKTSDDKFELINGNYHFRGRANNYRIGEEWISLQQIESAVFELFGMLGANIVVDPDYQTIYLAVWETNIAAEKKLNKFFDENYKEVKISYVLRNEKYHEYFNSRKIDNSKIRQVCRERILLEKTTSSNKLT